MSGEKIIGWRNRPACAASTGSSFLADPVFNGRNASISARAAATKALLPLTLLGSINNETKSEVQGRRRKLLKASI